MSVFEYDLHVRDSDIFLLKFVDRLKMCTDAGCFTACWIVETSLASNSPPDAAVSAQKLTIVDIERVKIVITIFNDDTWRMAFRNTTTGKGLSMKMISDPTIDNVFFEQLYLYVHHAQFKFCNLKQSEGFVPLDRLDNIEMQLRALVAANEDIETDTRISELERKMEALLNPNTEPNPKKRKPDHELEEPKRGKPDGEAF
jgi:hypothetical protein